MLSGKSKHYLLRPVCMYEVSRTKQQDILQLTQAVCHYVVRTQLRALQAAWL